MVYEISENYRELLAMSSVASWSGKRQMLSINPLNDELNPTCHLLALLGSHHTFHVSGLRVNWTSDQKCFCNLCNMLM